MGAVGARAAAMSSHRVARIGPSSNVKGGGKKVASPKGQAPSIPLVAISLSFSIVLRKGAEESCEKQLFDEMPGSPIYENSETVLSDEFALLLPAATLRGKEYVYRRPAGFAHAIVVYPVLVRTNGIDKLRQFYTPRGITVKLAGSNDAKPSKSLLFYANEGSGPNYLGFFGPDAGASLRTVGGAQLALSLRYEQQNNVATGVLYDIVTVTVESVRVTWYNLGDAELTLIESELDRDPDRPKCQVARGAESAVCAGRGARIAEHASAEIWLHVVDAASTLAPADRNGETPVRTHILLGFGYLGGRLLAGPGCKVKFAPQRDYEVWCSARFGDAEFESPRRRAVGRQATLSRVSSLFTIRIDTARSIGIAVAYDEKEEVFRVVSAKMIASRPVTTNAPDAVVCTVGYAPVRADPNRQACYLDRGS